MEGQANGHSRARVDEVLRHSRALRDEAGALAGELKGSFDEVAKAMDLKGRMERHPWMMVAAAVGVGYVLGGGLFSRTTARLIHLGSRAVLLPLVRTQLEAFAAHGVGPAPGYGGSEDGQGGM